MANKNNYVVVTDVGTFRRGTDRTYTHIVVGAGYTDAAVERSYAYKLERSRDSIDFYRAVLDGSKAMPSWETVDSCRGRLSKAEAEMDELTAFGALDAMKAKAAADPHGVLGWCGRLDLAIAQMNRSISQGNLRDIRVYAVATGERVR